MLIIKLHIYNRISYRETQFPLDEVGGYFYWHEKDIGTESEL